MIKIEKREKVDIISFSVNNINALITDDLRENISRLFDVPNSRVIIDLKGVEYIDSAGFGCFLSVMKSARNNYGTLKFANPEQRVMELLRILHLHTIFQIFENIETCIGSFK